MPATRRRLLASFALNAALAATLAAQTPPPAPQRPVKTDSQLQDEYAQARQLRTDSKILQALPLFEDLHAQRPESSLYTEGLAMAYTSKAATEPTPQLAAADNAHARELFVLAQKLGDNSDLVQIMLDKLPAPGTPIAPPRPRIAGQDSFDQAEVLFAKGDLAGAIPLYSKAWETNPTFYQAALFAGDSNYKLANYDQASLWFTRAIGIDPNIETVHRYWGDSLAKEGKLPEARAQFIQAVIASPYEKGPRLELRAFLNAHGEQLVRPAITLPVQPGPDSNGNMTITLDPKGNPADMAAALAYSGTGLAWQQHNFKQHFPNEKTYRHSLPEELASIQTYLSVYTAGKTPPDKLSPTVRNLLALQKAGMLEPWILLDNPDRGIAQDYAPYRLAHRDLLATYIAQYDLQKTPAIQ